MELLNELLPYILPVLGTILTAVATYFGSKLANYIDTRKHSELIREIVHETVKYVEQVGNKLGSEEKFDLAKQKAIEWANSKGLQISEIELEILIESFVSELANSYKEPVGTE